jgi:hypothetical protein
MFKKLAKRIYFHFCIIVNRINSENKWQLSYRKDVLHYYLVELSRRLNKEEREVIKYLKYNTIHYFPYLFISKYNPENINIFFDSIKNLKYVLHEGKRLYFKKKWDNIKIKNAYNFLLIEQDPESPHRYLTESFNVNEGDVVLDIGTGEGNFAISIIEKVKKIFLFESDNEWIEALQATFEPWKEKVVIINKFVSDLNSDTTICLDEYIREKINFLKADVEGEEISLLEGAKKILLQYCPKLIICTYHKSMDAENIKNFMMSMNYDVYFSNGYMIFLDDPTSPYLRKGLIRAEKLCH